MGEAGIQCQTTTPPSRYTSHLWDMSQAKVSHQSIFELSAFDTNDFSLWLTPRGGGLDPEVGQPPLSVVIKPPREAGFLFQGHSI